MAKAMIVLLPEQRWIIAMAASRSFPDHFPEDCPFSNARNIQMEAYRWVGNDPPQPQDFVPLSQQRGGLSFSDSNSECQACGLSVFVDAQDAILAQKCSKSLRGKRLAVGIIEPESGKVAPTPRDGNSHHTWWPYAGEPCHVHFRLRE